MGGTTKIYKIPKAFLRDLTAFEEGRRDRLPVYPSVDNKPEDWIAGDLIAGLYLFGFPLFGTHGQPTAFLRSLARSFWPPNPAGVVWAAHVMAFRIQTIREHIKGDDADANDYENIARLHECAASSVPKPKKRLTAKARKSLAHGAEPRR